MTNVTNVHICTFSRANTVLSIVGVMSGELVQFTGDMVGGACVIIPVGINSIGCKVCTLVATISIILGSSPERHQHSFVE
jgi:urea transporter